MYNCLLSVISVDRTELQPVQMTDCLW